MLIIGHRGAAGLAPENTLEALRAGAESGADILEFDVRLTKDAVPVLAHDAHFHSLRISNHTYTELSKIAPIANLGEALDEHFGKILLNIELKQESSVEVVYEIVKRYVAHPGDWDNVLFSSFKPKALTRLRDLDKRLSLALLHHVNPFTYMRYHKQLGLTAVGFHRLHINPVAVAVAKELGIFTYVYTIDRPSAAKRIEQKGVEGLVTNYPDRIVRELQADT